MLTVQECKKLLQKLDNSWPESLMLFSHSGTLLLVKNDTGQVLWVSEKIINDGGDPGTSTDGNGNEFLRLFG